MTVVGSNNTRIAKNTLLLYFRMLFTMIVSLYTSRVVLKVLGVEDFGVYNVVGGVVAMFSVISGSLSTAISRYITYELGKHNIEQLKKVFSTAIAIQALLALLIIILAEIARDTSTASSTGAIFPSLFQSIKNILWFAPSLL